MLHICVRNSEVGVSAGISIFCVELRDAVDARALDDGAPCFCAATADMRAALEPDVRPGMFAQGTCVWSEAC